MPHCTKSTKHTSEGSTLPLKFWTDVTGSPVPTQKGLMSLNNSFLMWFLQAKPQNYVIQWKHKIRHNLHLNHLISLKITGKLNFLLWFLHFWNFLDCIPYVHFENYIEIVISTHVLCNKWIWDDKMSFQLKTNPFFSEVRRDGDWEGPQMNKFILLNRRQTWLKTLFSVNFFGRW